MLALSTLFAMMLVSVDPAAAEIRIRESRLENGKLIVRGETEPGRAVTLDKKFETKANRYGRFTFSVPYRPTSCLADIRSGPDTYSAFVANCHNTGLSGPAPGR